MRDNGPVVIAVDGGAHSPLTIDWGLAAAELRGADAVLARTYQEPREVTQAGWYPVLTGLRFDTEATDYLAEQLTSARAAHPDLTVTTRLLHGPEVPELLSLSGDAQLLVVGARGHAGRRPLGRVSAHLAAHARCPVAIVRGVPRDPSAPVVVGVDGSPPSIVAAHVAAREALLRGLPLVIAHARPTIVAAYGALVLPPLSTSDEDDPTHRAAREAADQLRQAYPGLHVGLALVDDDPAHALVALSRDSALVVVGSRGMGAFRGMLLGAVSNEVVRGADASVLVVHGLPVA